MSRNKLYVARIEICITKKMKKDLEEEARNRDKTTNEFIRTIIEDYLS